LRCSKEQNALHTLIHQRHLTPSCGGHTPTAERTLYPARMFAESLTPRPELENGQDPTRTSAVLANGEQVVKSFCLSPKSHRDLRADLDHPIRRNLEIIGRVVGTARPPHAQPLPP